MNFEETIDDFTSSISEKKSVIHTEETTKLSLILPFMRILGYDTTNPINFRAEYTADIGVKRGEKVDFAILSDEHVEILIECKSVDVELEEKHLSQLFRYFSVTEAKLAILTNGLVYQFYTDSLDDNQMDKTPFFEINLEDYTKKDVNKLEKFTNENFDVSKVTKNAQELKFNNGVKKVLAKEFETPSDEFIKAIAKQVYEGQLHKKKKELFSKIITNKIKEIIDEKVNARLETAIAKDQPEAEPEVEIIDSSKIETSHEEWEGYFTIKGICSEIVDPDRIAIRDRKEYCNVLFDDNQYYPIAKLHFNNPKNLRVEFFDSYNVYETGSKRGNKVNIDAVKDIYKYKEKILVTVNNYLNSKK